MKGRQELIQHSIETILRNQEKNGAYAASPAFSQYGYSWMRDGSFIAYGMLLRGEDASTQRFLRWAAEAINNSGISLEGITVARKEGRPPRQGECFPARYTLSGELPDDEWPAFQTDGYGGWLWVLVEWMKKVGADSIPSWARTAVDTTVRYLERTWDLPTFDAWEENSSGIHPATLACLYGGLQAVASYGYETSDLTAAIRNLALSRLTERGTLPKYIGSDEVDASLIWATVPFGMVRPDDPVMLNTITAIESDLKVDGGLKRYESDTYYGGGRWLLLTAWYGWYYAIRGDRKTAEEAARWVEAQTLPNGDMPEQNMDTAVDVEKVASWTEAWGPVATPLLWSHAMYLVLTHALESMTD